MKFKVGQKVEFESINGTYKGGGEIIMVLADSPRLYLCVGINGINYGVYESDISLPTEETLVTFVAHGPLGHPAFTSTKKCKVTKHTNGYTVEIIPEPKFSIGETFVILSGKLGKVIGSPEYIDGKYTYEIQWTDGKKNKCQPEDYMIKLEEAFK